MSIASIDEYVERRRWQYRRATKSEKGRILDELCDTLQYHRKAAIRALHRAPEAPRRRRGHPRRYGVEVVDALRRVWEATDYLCGKRLAPFLPIVVPMLERCGELQVSDEVREQLVRLSAATIDRRLRTYRVAWTRQPHRPSAPPGSLKAQIPIRTFGEWKGVRPGAAQADLVLHCGSSVAGFYLSTLLVVDVATGWTECEAVWGVGRQRVGSALHRIRERWPVPLRELHTDNGDEFINHVLFPYCRYTGIQLTRGRPYKKNDQAYVEQRNWSVVRRVVGYERYSSKPAQEQLTACYALLRLYMNFLQPVRKLVGKERTGAQVRKRFDQAATPYQRLLASGALAPAQRQRLDRIAQALNPVQLRGAISDILDELYRHRQLPTSVPQLRVKDRTAYDRRDPSSLR